MGETLNSAPGCKFTRKEMNRSMSFSNLWAVANILAGWLRIEKYNSKISNERFFGSGL